MSDEHDSADDRRSFLVTGCMATGLAAGYGTMAVMAGRFLFPTSGSATQWPLVAPAGEIVVGEARAYTAPSGAHVVIARQTEEESAEAFIALSLR